MKTEQRKYFGRTFTYPLLTVAAIVPAVAVTAAEKSGRSTTTSRPNIILILMDDAGLGDFGCYGQQKIETPNIDLLAARGVLFTDMYSSSPVSAPSRCGLLTGLHSGHSQIRQNNDLPERGEKIWNYEQVYMDPSLEGQAPLKRGTATLGSVLQKSGYATAMVGKWGVGGPATESTPNKMGFDFYYGCMCQRMAHSHYPPYLWKNDEKETLNTHYVVPGTSLDKGADPMNASSYDKYSADNIYAPDVMFDNVLGFIDRSAAQPFFLMWTTPLPHTPLQAPQQWVDKYVQKFGDEQPLNCEMHLNEHFHNYYPCRYPYATYAAMISYFDDQLGRLVAHLKELGIYDNTVIIFTSDNGPANNAVNNSSVDVCSPALWFDSAHPYRCGKGWAKANLHEGGIHMPFIVSWPAKMIQGSVSSHIGYFPDVMPTLCEIAGAKTPATDGVSLMPTITGRATEQKAHEFLYWEFPSANGQVAVRYGKWKGLVQRIKSKGNHTMELYDLSHPDRNVELQSRNVATAHPDIVAKMWQFIKASHIDAEDTLYNMDIFETKTNNK